MLKEAKLGIELERVSLAVPTEHIFSAKPGEPSRVHEHEDRLHQVGIEGAKQPGADHGVHKAPGRGG